MLLSAVVRKAMWVSELVFLGIGAWLLAGTANAVASAELRDLPDVSPSAPVVLPEPTLQVKDHGVIVRRNLFGSAMKTVDPPEKKKKKEIGMRGAPSKLDAGLVGTVVADDPRWSLGLLVDRSRKETGLFRVGDPFMGDATVVSILSQRVYLERFGEIEYIDFDPDQAPVVPARAKPKQHTEVGIQQLGPRRWKIDRESLGDPFRFARTARLVPAFESGETKGFKVFSIRPGSPLSSLGFQNGDIVRKINGYAINSPEVALEVYKKFKSARVVEIEIHRGPSSLLHTFELE